MQVSSLNLGAASDALVSSQQPVSTLEYAGFLKRAGARIVDLIVHFGVALVSGVFVILLVAIAGAISGSDTAPLMERMGQTTAASRLVALFGFILYSIILEGLFGATAGKYLLGLVVLSEDDARPATYTQAVGRSFAFVLDALFFGLIGYLAMKNSPQQQRHGDKWAGTVVVTRASAPRESLRTPLRFVGAFILAVFLDGLALAASALL